MSGRERQRALARAGSTGLLGMLLVLLGAAATAQEGVRPGDQRLPLPTPAPSAPEPALVLPPLRPLSDALERRLSAGARGYVTRITVEGSSVFSAAELAEVVAAFEDRLLGSEELLLARDAVTRLYRDRGYITSGAVLPDQDVRHGQVVLRVIEGRLGEIRVVGTRSFAPAFFRDRLAAAGQSPVNIFRLERALQRLQQNPQIERIHAALEPGESRGEGHLRLSVQEAPRLQLELAASNHRTVSIGEFAGEVTAAAANLVGFGDELRFGFEAARGLRDYEISYSIPVSAYDTLLVLGFRDSDGAVVLDEFAALDIESEARSVRLAIEQPLLRDYGRELRVGLAGELRESETRLGSRDFCTVVADSSGAEPLTEDTDCDPKVAALRVFAQYIARTPRSALALRSTLSAGLDVLGATENPPSVADGRFFSWLAQAQFVARLPEMLLASEAVARVDAQLANDPLLSIEKFSVGGARTVRGFRENLLVRDSGVVASLELRIPVVRRNPDWLRLSLVPFADYGRAWDHRGPARLGTHSIASLGMGLRARLFGFVYAELYYGAALTPSPGDDPSSLQRHGLHFRVSVDALAPLRARTPLHGLD